MNFNFFLLVVVIFSGNLLLGQVGINTNTPQATLEITTKLPEDKVLRLSQVHDNVDAKAQGIDYTHGSPLYIDKNGYVYKSFTPPYGLSNPFDNDLKISTTWTTIYTLPAISSIANFSFFTNFSLGEGGRALVSGQISVGTGSGINLYDYNSAVQPVNNIVRSSSAYNVTINFITGAGLEFQLTSDRMLQVRLTTTTPNSASILIYNSRVTRTF